MASILKEKLSKFNLKTVDDLLANVGAGDIGINIIMGILNDRVEKETPVQTDNKEIIEDIINRKPAEEILKKTKHRSGIVVEGVGDLMTHMAKCCQPIPGDEIIGFVTQGRGISVHRKDCENSRE